MTLEEKTRRRSSLGQGGRKSLGICSTTDGKLCDNSDGKLLGDAIINRVLDVYRGIVQEATSVEKTELVCTEACPSLQQVFKKVTSNSCSNEYSSPEKEKMMNYLLRMHEELRICNTESLKWDELLASMKNRLMDAIQSKENRKTLNSVKTSAHENLTDCGAMSEILHQNCLRRVLQINKMQRGINMIDIICQDVDNGCSSLPSSQDVSRNSYELEGPVSPRNLIRNVIAAHNPKQIISEDSSSPDIGMLDIS